MITTAYVTSIYFYELDQCAHLTVELFWNEWYAGYSTSRWVGYSTVWCIRRLYKMPSTRIEMHFKIAFKLCWPFVSTETMQLGMYLLVVLPNYEKNICTMLPCLQYEVDYQYTQWSIANCIAFKKMLYDQNES